MELLITDGRISQEPLNLKILKWSKYETLQGPLPYSEYDSTVDQ